MDITILVISLIAAVFFSFMGLRYKAFSVFGLLFCIALTAGVLTDGVTMIAGQNAGTPVTVDIDLSVLGWIPIFLTILNVILIIKE